MKENGITLVIDMMFIVIDYATGITKAWKTETISSKKMREGLFHKAALVFILAIACLLEWAQGYIDLGCNVPLVTMASIYIIVMEVASALENICVINPEIMPEKLMALFGFLKKHDDKFGDTDKEDK